MSPKPQPPTPKPLSRSSVRAWLLTRQPSPPATLASKISELVDAAPDSVFTDRSVAAVAGALGTWVLQSVVERQKAAYDTAMDLLAADAFVTYAFEAAAEEGGDVTGLAERLLADVRAGGA